ncbi:MAG TPA: hypothetical protein ENN73_01875, partial [Firmicutes bacterium]|nr:hypothetical protein [Bacillota bacterium]
MDQVGKSIPRTDGFSKVTGSARFIDDYHFDGMLYASVFRAPCPRGRIINLDKSLASALAGVHGIFTAKDIPGKNIVPVVDIDQPLLADEIFNFTGEAIAIAVADDPDTAEEAVSLLKLEYESLPPVLTIEDALS